MKKINNKWYHTKEEKEKVSKANRGKVDIKNGKTYEEFYGLERAKRIKLKLSKQTSSRSQDIYNKISKALIGRKFSKEHKQKLSENKKIFIQEHPEWREQRRICTINHIINTNRKCKPNIGKNEKQFLDEISKSIKYKIIRQYQVKGYFVDGYCKELNIVFEIDERPKNKERDIRREKEIKQELNCNFVRI